MRTCDNCIHACKRIGCCPNHTTRDEARKIAERITHDKMRKEREYETRKSV